MKSLILTFLPFILAFLTLTLLVFYYFKRRFISVSSFAPGTRKKLQRVLLGVLLFPVITMPARFLFPENITPISWISFSLMGLVAFTLTYSILRDFLYYFTSVGSSLYETISRKELSPENKVSRRQFFSSGMNYIVGAATVTSAAKGVTTARSLPTIERVEVHLKNLPPSFDGFTIAQISCVHVI